jgi:PD-(D/E)XK nuclease superfamily
MITSWSPSRLDKYKGCPRRAKYDIVDKLCPMCFEGRLTGGFGTPVTCDTCGQTIADPPAIARGSEIGASLERYVNGKSAALHIEVRHPEVKKQAKILRTDFKRGVVKVEEQIVLDQNWKPVSKFTKGAWFRGKLDVLRFNKLTGEVIDWKTGGIDKRDGSVRVQAKYDDQLAIYSLVALVQFPDLQRTESKLIFTDTGPRHNPVVMRDNCNLTRADVPKQQKRWEGEVKAMLTDKVFKPSPGEGCRWCPFSKAEGGPCPN